MAFIDNDEFPQEIAQVLPVLDADFVCCDDHWKLCSGVTSISVVACPISWTSFADITHAG
jgi:hypothetical protein